MATAAPLNPEPALPEEREKMSLPPKSYVDAAQEGIKQINIDNNTDSSPAEFTGQGEVEIQPSSAASQKRRKENGYTKVKGPSVQADESATIVEDFQDKNGDRLTSTKLAFVDEKRKPTRTQTELVSGRRAGAGWDRSGFVHSDTFEPINEKL